MPLISAADAPRAAVEAGRRALARRRKKKILFAPIFLSIWELQVIPLGHITWGVILGVLYLGIISTALAMFLWNKAFAILEAGVASLTFFAQPVVGASLGALFLHEEFSLLFILGGALIGLGLWLAARPS